MEKMKFETDDLSQQNVEKIGKLFPNCITEAKDANGKLKKAIDFEMLKQMLSDDVIDEGDEAYEFTWVGKKEAMVEANKPIRKTLRPCREESKDWDNTENLYIEGDNLEVLKLLQESYLNKVKMIYIDPPYNTGNDFIYNDDFKMDSDEYRDESGEVDEEGNRLFKNTDTNGRFHSDWCSMMYSRLMLARNLLSEDGVIFISIDDNEVMNLTKICDEIFGEKNRISLICHKARASVSNDKVISPSHNTILFYAKEFDNVFNNRKLIGLDPVLDNFKYDDNDGKGEYRLVPVDGPGGAKKGNPYYTFLGVEGYFRFSKETMKEKYNNGFVVKKGNSLYQKYYKRDAMESRKTATTWWDDGFLTSSATSKLRKMLGGSFFDNPKPIDLIERMLKMMTYNDDSIVLDFFSGSATTAHAVMDLNVEDGGNRKFIMVQLPEECDEKSEAYKAGYKNICEIGKERIRRAGEKIKSDNANKEGIENLDTGFRVLKVDDTNMKDVYYTPDEYSQRSLFDLESNIKEDRTELDLLYGCLIEWGIPLNKSYESKNIDGSMVHIYNDGDLIACFDEDITEEAIKKIAKMEPLRAVFRDSSFKTSAEKINVEEIFKLLSPETSVRVI